MNREDVELIAAAAVFAADAHAGQKRKELNEPYIIHPLRVGKMAAQLGQSAEFIAACYLHDVVEDTNIPMLTIVNLFPPGTCTLVTAATKWWAEGHASEVVKANKDAYYAQILRTPGAVLLKVLDRVDNLHDFAKMARMSPSTHKWAKKYYAKTTAEFQPLLAALPEHMWAPEAIRHMDDDRLHRALRFYEVALAGLEAAL